MAELFATAALGTEDLVAGELRRLKMKGVVREHSGVRFEGELAEAMRACLHLRSAQRVLLPLGRFRARDSESLYAGAREVAWEQHITSRHTIAVAATTRAAPPLAHGPFLAQRVKDAIVDRLR